jgi:hypothetical protein
MPPEPKERVDLTTWKEIADYFGVTARTVQLWERHRGLPVRRLPGGMGRVSARVSELQAWRDSGKTTDGNGDGKPQYGNATWQNGKTLPAGPLWLRLGYLGAFAVLAVGIGIALWSLWPSHPGPPAMGRVEFDSIIISDANGKLVWKKTLPERLESYEGYALSQDSPFWFGDLDGDGRQEILFSELFTKNGIHDGRLVCFGQDGSLRWEFKPRKELSSRKERFTEVYRPVTFTVGTGHPRYGTYIVVSSLNERDYPTQIALLSRNGELLREYWHSGYVGLHNLRLADWDGDGREELFLGGVSNGYGCATLVVLDPDTMEGASVEQNQDYQLQGCKPGKEIARLLFPRSCINRRLYQYNGLVMIRVSPNRILVEVREHMQEPGPLAPIAYSFGPDFGVESIRPTDEFLVMHNRLFIEGTLDHRYDESELEALKLVRVLRAATPQR